MDMIRAARIILFLGLVGLSPLAAYGRDLGPSHVPDDWCPSEKGDCERRSLAAFRAYAHRINKTTLALTLRTGRKVLLSNPDDCQSADPRPGEGCEYFSLDFYFRQRGLFLISVGRYEWVEWILVNDHTGHQTRLLGRPIFSPSGREFVVAINQGSSSGIAGAFEIWDLRSNTPARSFRFEPNAAIPLQGKADWQGDDRIVLSYDDFPRGGPYDRAYTQTDTAVRDRNGWCVARREPPATNPVASAIRCP